MGASEKRPSLSDSRFDSRYSRRRSAFGFVRLLGQPDEVAGDAEELGVEGEPAFEDACRFRVLGGDNLRPGRSCPRHRRRPGLLLGVGGDSLAESCFGLACLRFMKSASRRPPRPPMRALRLFWMPKRSSLAWRYCSSPCWPYSLQERFRLVRGSRAARGRRRRAGTRGWRRCSAGWCGRGGRRRRRGRPPSSRRAPLQVVLDLGGLAVLVGAEEADVEVVAGVLEVVSSPPKKAMANSGAKTSRTSVYFL